MSSTPYLSSLSDEISRLGGFRNGHLHLDRAETLSQTLEILESATESGVSHISLQKKHALISRIHETNAYENGELKAKLKTYLNMMATMGTSIADSLIDVTFDKLELDAFKVALEVREELHGVINFNVAAYNPLGFRDDQPKRWELFESASNHAQFIGLLPERDDREMYPDHIGFDESCLRSMTLAKSLSIPLHIHVDQTNLDHENASERVLDIYERVGKWATKEQEEICLWLIHVISPTAYDENRFLRLRDRFSDLGVGLITCPSAAISMRQVRPIYSPTHNSIARVLDFLAAGVPVRIGSDNICDITSPFGTPDLRSELFVLAHALRFFEIPVLAKIASGKNLTIDEIVTVKEHLIQDTNEVARIISGLPHNGTQR